MVSAIKKRLKTMVMENTTAWEKLIPLAAFACNTALRRETREAPFFLVHGRDAVLPGPVNTAVDELRSSAEVVDPEIYVQNLRERILTAFEHTTKRLKAIQNSYMHIQTCWNRSLKSEIKYGCWTPGKQPETT